MQKNKIMKIMLVDDEIHFSIDGHIAARLIVSNIKDDKSKVQNFIKDYLKSKASYFASLAEDVEVVDYHDEKFQKELSDIFKA